MKTKYTDQDSDIAAWDASAGGDTNDGILLTVGAGYASALAASNPDRTYQWYLDGTANGASNGAGANIDAISTEYDGRGVVIGIVDEGFDTTNLDLAGRFDLSQSYDPRDHGVTNIMPDSVLAKHGTWVAGVIGASEDNDFGIVGVAPDATLAGFYTHFGAGGSTRAELADLLARQVNVDVSNNSWGYTTEFSDNFRDPSWAGIANALQTDTMIGGAGNDTYMVDNPGDTIVEYANEGYDMVFAHADYTLGANVESMILSGPDGLSGTGNDLANVIVGNDAGDTIDGAGGDDLLAGGAGNDHISGGEGGDWIYGLGGNDLLEGGAGNDVLFGGDGDDALLGGAGDNFMSGDAGADRIVGGSGNDFLFGGDGNDLIDGGDGNDVLAGQAGDDTLIGGAGVNWLDGGDGNDVLRGGNGSNALFGGAGDDQLYGGDGVNGLDGGAGNDLVVGGAGEDWIIGGDGNDILIGGAGNDVLAGGDGDNRLVGGQGADFLQGGAGADTFVFNTPAEGGDVVTDFTSGVDLIEINAAGFGLAASGALPDAMFAEGSGLPADFGSDTPTFFGDAANGALWFDPTGGSSSDAVLVAGFVSGLPAASDFHLV